MTNLQESILRGVVWIEAAMETWRDPAHWDWDALVKHCGVHPHVVRDAAIRLRIECLVIKPYALDNILMATVFHPKPVPWWAGTPLEERHEAFYDDLEQWHECYAEAGSSFVFGGGNPMDANLAASESVGPEPQRWEYGL